MKEKEAFIEEFKLRTKKFAVDIIGFCSTMNKTNATYVITNQIIRSATSTGANYRAACRARSKAEFYSKICIVVEEADESEYWLEIIDDSGLSNNNTELERLIKEANEITKVVAKAKHTIYSEKK